MPQRNDIDVDGAGQEFYTPEAEDYIQRHAERLGKTFDEAATLYEKARRFDRCQYLHEIMLPTVVTDSGDIDMETTG